MKSLALSAPLQHPTDCANVLGLRLLKPVSEMHDCDVVVGDDVESCPGLRLVILAPNSPPGEGPETEAENIGGGLVDKALGLLSTTEVSIVKPMLELRPKTG